MNATDTAPAQPDTAACACGHLRRQHDAVAARFCAATDRDGLQRPCVCRVEGAAEARSYDRR